MVTWETHSVQFDANGTNGLGVYQINLCLQRMIQAGIIFLAIFFDSLRGARLLTLQRRFIRVEI
jgi:hypothetical protein